MLCQLGIEELVRKSVCVCVGGVSLPCQLGIEELVLKSGGGGGGGQLAVSVRNSGAGA